MNRGSRALGWCVAALVAAGCNDTPTAPSPPPTPAFTLAPGRYTLTIAVGTRPGTPTTNPCREATTATDRAAVPVTVSAESGRWRMTPDEEADLGLVVTLESLGRNALAGPIRGRARDASGGVVVSVEDLPVVPGLTSAPYPASMFGSLTAANLVDGVLTGDVTFTDGTGRRSCASVLWSLEPR